MTQNGDLVSNIKASVKNFDVNWFIARVTAILKDPKGIWTSIRGNGETVRDVYAKYLVFAAVVTFLVAVLKHLVFGPPSMGPVVVEISFGQFLYDNLLQLTLNLIFPFVGALVLEKLVPVFGGSATKLDGLQLLAYAWAGAFAGSVLYLVPFVGWLFLLMGAFYSLYTLFVGFGTMTAVPEGKRVPAFLAFFIVMIVLFAVVTAIF